MCLAPPGFRACQSPRADRPAPWRESNNVRRAAAIGYVWARFPSRRCTNQVSAWEAKSLRGVPAVKRSRQLQSRAHGTARRSRRLFGGLSFGLRIYKDTLYYLAQIWVSLKKQAKNIFVGELNRDHISTAHG